MASTPQQRVEQMCALFREQAESIAIEKQTEAAKIADQYYDQQISLTTNNLQTEAERQEKEIEVNRQIQNAKITNSAKLEILKAQKKALNECLEEAKNRLNEFSKGPDYPLVLAKLIAEGVIILKEQRVRLTVRKADVEICNSIIPKALEMVKSVDPNLDCKLIVDEERYLPADPHCAGGVVFTCHKGKIRLSNILNERLKLAYDGILPQIREIVLE
ncbi:hypothetical protein TVAG_099990 [Trichomonas vaginalis G3]|uniref:V-type proton ATPase subunit E n=1 Tax=Trichomonas vaginalis (strain ATCC PRA-98 / G3) TaxID=412133 RepID=A2EK66_TRIV3|nr:proton-transporting ATPase activity, rotational mechanism [Trichomonas vaginalis G3]EAY06959.1 hypothetical protein TVAG_099990 [Trichomonas vaginalis G3]KAI5499110.1 proton-transporting ATPase activity, rotational mechanism [Trichomonas vaginalis G3]|eukprot:XP_001319182.1 hypothetical protein [Trichomonas vaginalis G3]